MGAFARGALLAETLTETADEAEMEGIESGSCEEIVAPVPDVSGFVARTTGFPQ